MRAITSNDGTELKGDKSMKSSKQDEHFTDYVIRGGLSETARKLTGGRAVTVAFIGGSVTAGAGATESESFSYRARTCCYLERRYPQVVFRFVNTAIGGTDSTYGAFRLQEHVFQQGPIDLLFVEYAVNDAGDRNGSIKAMEGIVRQAKRLNPMIDLCFLYLANKSGKEKFAKNGKGQDNIIHHEEVAEHYRIPSVHIAGEIYRMIASGALQWEQISADEVHPNDYGYSLYARFLEDFLEEALQACDGESASNADLPTPLDPFCYEKSGMLSPKTALHASAWRMIHGWSTDQTCNWKPPADVYMAETPGDGFRMQFTGTAAGFSMLAGMDTGDIEVSIDEGEWQKVRLFDRYCTQFHRPKIVLVAVDLPPGEHTVDIKISDKRHEDSTGHAVRILKLLVN